MAGKLGRLKPHDPATHPRLRLGNYLTAYPAAPALVDYISAVNAWPMYGNDTIGDCTVAAAGHMIQAWTRYGQGATVTISEADVIAAYSAVSGYVPGRPSTDQGAVMQDVLSYWRKTGIGGHKILGYAEVDLRNAAELKAAMDLFGHVYLGINCPDTALDQFDDGQPWDVESGAEIEGGHAIDWGYAETGANHEVITWGAVEEMTPAFLAKYGEEAWVVLSQEWINAAGSNPEGLNVAALNADFTAMTGQPGPFPVQPEPSPEPPAPIPQPVPVPPSPGPDPSVAADVALADAVRAWLVVNGYPPSK